MKRIGIVIVISLLASGGVSVPAKAYVDASSFAPDEPTNVIAEAARNGTVITWDEPTLSSFSSLPRAYVVNSCGPYTLESKKASLAAGLNCDGEDSFQAIIVKKSATSALAPCLPTTNEFCVVSLRAIGNKVDSSPVVRGAGGPPPNSVSQLTVIENERGPGVNVAWSPSKPTTGVENVPGLVTTYELARNGIIVARGLTDTAYTDTGCDDVNTCVMSVTAVSPGGRSRMISASVASNQTTQWYSMTVPGTQLEPIHPKPASAAPIAVSKKSVSSFSLRSPLLEQARNIQASSKDMPNGIKVIRGNKQVKITWLSPASKIAISSYKVSTIQKPVKSCTYRVSAGSTENSCVISGLKNGVAYTFVIVAKPKKGKPISSRPSVSIKPAPVPNIPTGVVASVDGEKIVVSWNALPKSSAVATSFRASSVQNVGLSCTYVVPKAGASVNSCSITGAAKGMNNSFRVIATNKVGSSGASNASGNVVLISTNDDTNTKDSPSPSPSPNAGVVASPIAALRIPPGPPEDVKILRGNGRLVVSWRTPKTVGSSAIDSYVATVVGNPSKSCSYDVPSSGESADSCTITGLNNGILYTVAVVAKNSYGSSKASDESNSAMPATVPNAPTGVVTLGGDSRAMVTWNAADDNGSEVTLYEVTTVQAPTRTCSNTVPRSGVPTHSCSITGLTRGQSYTFTVKATNSVGDSPVSAPSASLTLLNTPTSPIAVTFLSQDQSAKISWQAPFSNGGGPIVSYKAWDFDDPSQSCTYVVPSGVSSNFCFITGLTNGTFHRYVVAASNAAVTGFASSPSGQYMVGGAAAPTSVVATATDGAVEVTWVNPTTPVGMRINSYRVTPESDADPRAWSKGCTFNVPNGLSPALGSCSIAGLIAGLRYTFTVSPRTHVIGDTWNSVGLAAESTPSNAVRPFVLPSQPLSVAAYATSDGAVVAWEPPANDAVAAIVTYEVSADPVIGETIVSEFDGEARVIGLGGLIKGVEYVVSVVAVNEFGESDPAIASEPALWTALASKPLSVTASGRNSSAVVSWSPPESIPIPVQSYTVTAVNLTAPSEVIEPMIVSTSPMTFPGLTNLSEYRFSVVANNEAGASPTSEASAAVRPVGPPSAPSNTLSFSSSRLATIDWLVPDSDSPITSYTLIATPISGAVHVVTISAGDIRTYASPIRGSANILGLTNGVEYTMSLFATSAGGNSTVVTGGSVTPLGRPVAPVISSVTTSNGKAVVSWTVPTDDGGADIIGYQVDASARDAASGSCTAVAPATTCTITGLNNGYNYSFSMRAENSQGFGGYASVVDATPLSERPSVPTNISASASTADGEHRRINITWDAPDNGGAIITRYNVKTVEDFSLSATCTTTGATTCYIQGLTIGNSYTFKVSATNSVGSSEFSVASASVVAPGPPSVPPEIDSIIGSGGNATVSFTPPTNIASLGPNPSYRVTATDRSTGSTYTSVGTSSPITYVAGPLTGLTVGRTYDVTIIALNKWGQSSASTAVTFVSSYPPQKPTSVSAEERDGAAQISFVKPADDSGAPISGYTTTINDLTTPKTWEVTQGPAIGFYGINTITGLTNGHSYTFSMVATNAAGHSEMSLVSNTVVPLSTPLAPRNPVATKGDGTISVAFEAPLSAGEGSPITGYRVIATLPGSIYPSVATGTTSPIVVGGLLNGSGYSVEVQATKGYVRSASATIAGLVTPARAPSAPINVSGTRFEDAQSVVSFTVWNNGGEAPSSYTITATNKTNANDTLVQTGSTNPMIVTGLTNGEAYSFSVSATNSVGTSARSPGSVYVVPVGRPSAPVVTSILSGNSAATVSFNAPTDSGGADISGYTIAAVSSTNPAHNQTAIGTASPITISGLTSGDSYRFTVTATNAGDVNSVPFGGVGASSVSLFATPSAPDSLQVVSGDASAEVSWTPVMKFGETASSYVATASPGGRTCTAIDVTNCVITGLTNEDDYTITVVARNSTGNSPASTPIAVIPNTTVPATQLSDAPTGVTVSALSGSLVVSWTRPANSYGTLEGYEATASPGGGTCMSLSVTRCSITGVNPYAIYTVSVRARNYVGLSAPSVVSSEVSTCGLAIRATSCATNLAAAQSVSVQRVAGGMKVSWSPTYEGEHSAIAEPSGLHCEASKFTGFFVPGARDRVGYTYCIIPGVFDATEVFRVRDSVHGSTTASFHPITATHSAQTYSNAVTPVVTGTLSSGSTVTVIASPTTCVNPLDCTSSISFAGAVSGGVFSVPLDGISDGSYMVYVEDPGSNIPYQSTNVSLTVPTSMKVDRIAPTPLTLVNSDGVNETSYGTAASVAGSAECDSTTEISVTWYDGTAASGTPITVTTPTRYAGARPTFCSFGSELPTTIGARTIGDGRYFAVARMVDTSGNVATSSLLVVVDNVAPVVALLSPVAGESVPDGVVTVSGTSSTSRYAVSATVMATGDRKTVAIKATKGSTTITKSVVVADDDSFSTNFELVTGTWAITVSRSDAAGNVTTTAQAAVSVETQSTDVAIILPIAGSTVLTNTRVVGWARPGAKVFLTEGATNLGTVTAGANGEWALELLGLTTGAHTFVATVDEISSDVAFSVGTSVSLGIATPGAGGYSNGRPLLGTASPGSTVSVSIDGVVATTTANVFGSWSYALSSVAAGTHVMTASDGSATTSPKTIRIDRTAPVLAITTPTASTTKDLTIAMNSESRNGDSSYVNVYFLDPSDTTNSPQYSYRVLVADGVATSNMSSYLADGSWIVVASRTDAAGNVTTAQVPFTLDTTAPSFTSNVKQLMPGPLTLIGAGSTMSGDENIQISIDGGTPWTAPTAGAFSYTPSPSLTSGAYTVVMTQVDAVGNVSRVVSRVVVDSVFPNVTLSIDDSGVSTIDDYGRSVRGLRIFGEIPDENAGIEATFTPDDPSLETVTRYVYGTFASRYTYSANVTLDEGWWTVGVSRTDAAGNKTILEPRRALVVLRAPSLSLTGTSGLTRVNTPTISGLTPSDSWRSGSVNVSVTATGATVPSYTGSTNVVDGIFSLQTSVLPEGSYTALVTRSDDRYPATANTAFTIDRSGPLLDLDAVPPLRIQIRKLCGNAGELATDSTTVSIALRSSTGELFTQTVPVAYGRFCVVPPDSGVWAIVATQSDAVGNETNTASTSASFDLDVPTPTANETSSNYATVPTPAWRNSIEGLAGTDTGDSSTVSISLTRDTTCVGASCETVETCTGGSCTQLLTTAVASDGTWKLSLAGLTNGYWHLNSVTQTDAIGNTGSFVVGGVWRGIATWNSVDLFRFRVDNTPTPTPILTVTPESVGISVCAPASPNTFSVYFKIFKGSTAGVPLWVFEIPRSAWCETNPIPLIKANLTKPNFEGGRIFREVLKNGIYTVLAESSDSLGNIVRTAPVTYRSDWVTPQVETTGVTDGVNPEIVTSAPFGSAAVIRGTAQYNDVDPRVVSVKMLSWSGDLSYRTNSPTSFVYVADVPVLENGTWSLTLPTNFPAGTFEVRANQGLGTAFSRSITITQDETTIDAYNMRSTTLSDGTIESTFVLSGAAPKDRTISSMDVRITSPYITPSMSKCLTVEVSNGRWSCSMTGVYPDGSYSFTATSNTTVSFSRCRWVTSTISWKFDACVFSSATGTQKSTSAILTANFVRTVPLPTIVSPVTTKGAPLAGVVSVVGTSSKVAGSLAPVTLNIYSGSVVTESPAQSVVVSTFSSETDAARTFTRNLTLGDGTWTLQAVQESSSDGVGRSGAVVIVVDSTPPIVSFGWPAVSQTIPVAFVSGTLSGGYGDSTNWWDAASLATTSVGQISYYPGTATSGTATRVNRVVATVAGGNKFFDTPALGNGTWTAVLRATDRSGNAVAGSNTRTFTVNSSSPAPLTPTITAQIGAGYSFDPALSGALNVSAGNRVVQVTVAGPLGASVTPTPTGTVSVMNGASVIGTATLNRGVGVATINLPAVNGAQSLRVSYGGDASNISVSTASATVTPIGVEPTNLVVTPSFPNGAAGVGSFKISSSYQGVSNTVWDTDRQIWVTTTPNIVCTGGSATITDSAGKILGSGAVSSASIVSASTLAGVQDISVAFTDGENCRAKTFTSRINIGATSLADPTFEISDSNNYVGNEMAVTVSIPSTVSSPRNHGVPVWLVAGGTNTVISSATVLTNSEGVAVVRLTPASAGTKNLSVRVGGNSAGFEVRTSSARNYSVEPARVDMALSVGPSATGGESAILVVGSAGLSGTVRIESDSGTVMTFDSLTCAATCGVSRDMSSEFLEVDPNQGMKAIFVSATTSKSYEVRTSLSRAKAAPTMTLAVGAGSPGGLRARSYAVNSSRISWKAPASNGAVITGYRVTATPGDFTCDTAAVETYCDIILNSGADYTFSVVTKSQVGAVNLLSSPAFAFGSTTPTPTTPEAPIVVDPMTAGTAVRDRLAPVVATFTYPASLAAKYRGGTISLRSAPDATCKTTYMPEELAAYCTETAHQISINASNGAVTESLKIKGINRVNLPADSLTLAGTTKDLLTPTTSATWSGNTLTIITSLFIGGTAFSVSAGFVPTQNVAVNSVTSSDTGLLRNVRVVGVGAPVARVSVGSANISGSWYGPRGRSLGNDYTPRVSSVSNWNTRDPRVGETAFVKSELDALFTTPFDRRVPMHLAVSALGAAPTFVDPNNSRFDQLRVAATPRVSPDSFPVNLACGTDCKMWTMRNLENTSPLITGGGLNVGSYDLGVISYAPGTGLVVGGSDTEIAARLGISSFSIQVDPWETSQMSQAVLTGNNVNVLTAARWLGLSPELQMSQSDVLVTVRLKRGSSGISTVIAMCFYTGVCLKSDGNGTNFYPTTAMTIDGQLSISIEFSNVSRPALNLDSISVTTSAPWAVAAQSSDIVMKARAPVINASGAASVTAYGKWLGAELEQPSLKSPLLIPLGAAGWQIYSLKNQLAAFEHDFFVSLFGEGKVAQFFMFLSTVLKSTIPGSWLMEALTCTSWSCAGTAVGLNIIKLPVKGLAAAYRQYKYLRRIPDVQTKLGMFVSKAKGFVANQNVRLRASMPNFMHVAIESQETLFGSYSVVLAKSFGVKGSSSTAKTLMNYVPVVRDYRDIETVAYNEVLRTVLNTPQSEYDAGFLADLNITKSIGEYLETYERSPNQLIIDNWQKEIESAYSQASQSGKQMVNDLGYGRGVAIRFIQTFASVVNIAVPNLADVDLASSTINFDAMSSRREFQDLFPQRVGSFGSCTFLGECTMEGGVSVTIFNGSMILYGVFPQKWAWTPPGAWLKVTVTAVPTNGAAATVTTGGVDIPFAGSKYNCIARYQEMGRDPRYTDSEVNRVTSECDDIEAFLENVAPTGLQPQGAPLPWPTQIPFNPTTTYSPDTALLTSAFR